MFSRPKLRIDGGFGQASQIQPDSIPEHLRVEWRLTIHEGHRKPQLFCIELTRGSNVGHKELGFGGKKLRLGHSFSAHITHNMDSFPGKGTGLRPKTIFPWHVHASSTVPQLS